MGIGAVAERLRAGDRAAFAEMYNEFAEPLLGLCIVLLRDRGDAEDAMHDAFILAAQRIDQLRDPERLRPWLFAIARHVCFRRIAQRRRTVPVASVPDIDLTHEDPTDGLAAAEVGELMWAAASGLNDRDRAALYLNTSQGLEGKMLTAALGVRHVNPHSLLNRAKRQLDRAIGVLLVARSGRHDCAELDGMLQDWDGTLNPLLRKRLGRHVDDCGTCRSTRVRAIAASSIAGIAALATQTADAMSGVFTANDLFDIAVRRPLSTERWQRDGFPPPEDPDSRRRRRFIIAVLLFAIIAGFGLFSGFHLRHAVRRPGAELQPAALVLPAPTSATSPLRSPASIRRSATPPTGAPTPRPRTAGTVPTGTVPTGTGTVDVPPPTAPSTPRLPPETTPAPTTPVAVMQTPVTVKRVAPTTTAPRPTPTTTAPPPTPTTAAPPPPTTIAPPTA